MQARANWQTDETAGLGGIAPDRLVFIDESAVLTSMARRYGRSPRGQRAYAKVPFGNWKRLSVLSALGIEGVLATMSIKDATDGDTFAAYLEQVLLPVLRARKPDAVLVMDNLRRKRCGVSTLSFAFSARAAQRFLSSDGMSADLRIAGWGLR